MSESSLQSESGGGADEVFAVGTELVRAVETALDEERWAELQDLVSPLHVADLADLLEFLPSDDRQRLVAWLGADLDPELLTELEEPVLADVVSQLSSQDLARAIVELDTDEALYLLENVPEARQAEVLDAVPAPDRLAVQEGLAYPEDSAGRLMQREFVAVPGYWTVGHVIDYCREAGDLPDEFYEIFIVDPRQRPIGSVPLNRVMRAKRPVMVRTIMEPENRVVPVAMDQEEVAYLFQQYRMASAPVVDEAGRMVGVVTFDDVAEVIQEEAEEDLMRLAGIAGETDIGQSVQRTARSRFTWLLVNLGTAVLASTVIGLFDASIEQMVALAVLMPIVASMGGNAGTQTLTVAVRALATRELTAANALRIVRKEVVVGGINGILFAVLIGAVAGTWFDDVGIGLVIAAAMVINLLVAGFAGILIPLALERLKIDPAVSAAVFLTTVTDVVGFFAFLGLAALFLL
jgi:magnesium transporter